ncbi:TPR-like protein [Metschnikowia bicuspidata]|uniref:TPR-like protein n=1 Tax=Metschnikowia bicuspidata TaxID=27322 RepID=A0A4P9ZI82_9ASCO|nr:TPR-like protein [Metschnikowia bicuspidata]
MSLKEQLKAAKEAIKALDGATALECADAVLASDPRNYFAHLFRARALQLLGHQQEAEKSFQTAVDLDPDNTLGWKAYVQLLQTGSSHQLYFRVLGECVKRLAEQNQSTAHVPEKVYAYLHRHNFKSDSELNEVFLRAILPGTPLGTHLEVCWGSTAENIRRLLVLVKSAEDARVLAVILKEKLKLPRDLTLAMRQLLDSVEWGIRQHSDVSRLYELYINHCDDDVQRRSHEVEYLRYKYALLRVLPEKKALAADVANMAADLVLLDCADVFPWKLHMDLLDVASVGDLDALLVRRFLTRFGNEPLAFVMRLFLMSEVSPFDRAEFRELNLAESTFGPADAIPGNPILGDPTPAATLQPDTEPAPQYLQAEIIELMHQFMQGSAQSLLAHRLVAHVYNFYGEYAASLKVCADGIRRCASVCSTYGIDLSHAHEDLTCQLALVYTYYEAPKNFGRALQIFDKILASNPRHEHALIGRGLILIEKGEYAAAEQLLAQVLQQSPDNGQALDDLGWCLVLQGRHVEGRTLLQRALAGVGGASLRAFDTRARITWRLATRLTPPDASQTSLTIRAAYDLLVQSLRVNKHHAPSYTLLGIILQNHYGDPARAQKCFYKAFELDVGEIAAAKYLVTALCAQGDWDVSEILCQRVVDSGKSRKALFSQLNSDLDRGWPYRVLGCSALNKQDDAKAIEWFQTALRMQAMDLQCWTGLGEAYFHCGRIDAAIKVFLHCVDLDPESWVAHYMLGQAVCTVGDYPSGLDLLAKARVMNPAADCVVAAEYEQCIMYCAQLLQGGFVGRALEYNRRAVDAIAKAASRNARSYALWTRLADCVRLLCQVQRNTEDAPYDAILGILAHADGIEDDVASLNAARDLQKARLHARCAVMLGVLASRAALSQTSRRDNKAVHVSAQFNAAVAYLAAFRAGGAQAASFRAQAVLLLKHALRAEPHNAQCWLALGNAYVTLNPALLQHCFIKGAALDAKDASHWTNLAAMYLRCGDASLAQEAFERAASTSPELPASWIGKALAAHVLGDSNTETRLTTHAQVLAKGSDPLVQLCYAVVVVQNRVGRSCNACDVAASQEVSVANAAMRRFLDVRPNDVVGLQLAAVLSERCYTHELSLKVCKRLCRVLEDAYEDGLQNTWDTLDMPQHASITAAVVALALAKAQLARVLLGCEQYEDAVENAQLAIDLLADELSSADTAKALLSARIVIGLAFFFNGQYSDALSEFQNILDEHSLSHRAVTLIAQVLYAIDSPGSKQAAVDHLFAFIEAHGSSLLVVMALGVISLAEGYTGYFDAIKDELEGLPLAELFVDTRDAVPRLLEELNGAMGLGNKCVWQKFALLFPGDFRVWRRLDGKMAVSAALLNGAKASAPELSAAYVQRGTRRDVQRALLVYADNRDARRIVCGKTL